MTHCFAKNTALWLNFIAILLFQIPLQAQTLDYRNDPADERASCYALTNATILVDYQTKLEKATLILRKAKIEAIGVGLAIPKEAIVIDCSNKYIYPAFLDLSSGYGLPAPKGGRGGYYGESNYKSEKQSIYAWNDAIRSEFDAVEYFQADTSAAQGYLDAGFGAVLAHNKDGICRGSGALVHLANLKAHELIVKERASAHYSFSKGSSQQSYPSSLMGSIALLRQTYLDASWYSKNTQNGLNLGLAAWNSLQSLPQFFEAGDKKNAIRADKIGDEFNKQYIIRGSGNEYQSIETIKATKATFILPVNFPKPYDVEDQLAAHYVDLMKLKHWEMAPANPFLLAQAGVNFCLTSDNLPDKTMFLANIRKAIQHGLDPTLALKALTQTPAALLGVENQLGCLKKGAFANFLLTSHDIFNEKNVIYENWNAGKRHILNDAFAYDHRGNFKLKIGQSEAFDLAIKGETATQQDFELKQDTLKIPLQAKINGQTIYLNFNRIKTKADEKSNDLCRLSGWYNTDTKTWRGNGTLENGYPVTWEANLASAFAPKNEADTSKKPNEKPELGKMYYPFAAYGFETKPKMTTVLFKNATVWTNEADGILKNTDVLIENGKIAKLGQNIAAPAGATVVNAEGKHLTAGIIDEHSHIGINGGVNEYIYSSSAESRISDVVDNEDIDIYRHLAGGVVAVQQLHGSANPIGGQSSIIKLKWGESAETMRMQNVLPRIKFALGENVKNSNSDNYVRYPQTRMGVEQVYEDAFTRAREYEKAKKANPLGTRMDLQLEAMLMIMKGEMLISCHSYVQSEINMLMKLTERFGFRVNTFTHILEGYKVADIMAKHGAGGSSFSDWWSYKFEVKDAIPYNATLMASQGVVVAINSDDAEMARRLNQEAAKSVKYGGMSEEEAFKMVTLNPAKLLKIEAQTGSIKVGKTADVVLWTANPLSVYARAAQTYIEGVCYFDIERDAALRESLAKERQRLIIKTLAAKKGGQETQPFQFSQKNYWHCDTITEGEFHQKGGHSH